MTDPSTTFAPSLVLITGAAGFVGRHIQNAVRERYPGSKLALMDHPATHICKGAGTVDLDSDEARLAADITCADELRPAFSRLTELVGTPDVVIHLAGQAAVARSFRSPAETYEVNVVGTSRLLEALAEVTLQARVLIPSSAQVYAPACTAAPLTESAPIGPSTHYGASKFAEEEVGRLFFVETGLPVFITRAYNHIGPGQQPGFVLPDFARQIAMIERRAAEGAETGSLRVGNLEARRDYLDVRDVAEAYLTVLERGDPGRPYNVASGSTWSARELLDVLLAEARVPVSVEEEPRLFRPLDVSVMAGDAARLRSLGWLPRRDIRQSVLETLDFWRRSLGPRLER